jgi:pyruvate/2-oxoglutarate dehydrogenase complex dihydrolipoamide dehydrogenase (E3) component
MKKFDAIILGAGQAGPPLAVRLTAAGMKVALIERNLFGGTCVNTGCTPTKTLIASAYAARLARRGDEYGIIQNGEVRVDMQLVKARADRTSRNSREAVERSLREMSGCTVIEGHARFDGPAQIRVNDDHLVAPRIFLNVGGRAAVPDLPGISEVPFLTNSSILLLDHVPKHLIIVGGSYVGLEFAQMYRRFGAQVTVVEKSPRLLLREDEDISGAIREILLHEGIQVRTGAECIRLSSREGRVMVDLECPRGEPNQVGGSHLLLATGRRPNTDDLGLQTAGVATDANGYIVVDESLSTNVPGIWALGDCNRRGAFTHTAFNDFEIVAANLLDGEHRHVSDRVFAFALYIDPPLGRVGMTDREARATGRPLLAGRMPMSRINRAVEKGETQGMMKITVDAETRKILGAAILGVGGDEVVHGILNLMNAGVTYDSLQRTVPIHPTVSELIPTMLSDLRPVAQEQRESPSGRNVILQEIPPGMLA